MDGMGYTSPAGRAIFSVQYRYVLCFLAFCGYVCNYMLRVNMNMAIISMVNHTGVDHDNNNTSKNSTNNQPDGPFLWDSVTRNFVVASFFLGYVVMQMPGGRLAEVYGGKKVMMVAMGGTAILTLIIPEAARWGGEEGFPWYLIILRIVMGIFEGATFPCGSAMMAKWAPVTEKSAMSTFMFAGSQVGTIVAWPVTSLIADTIGWQYIFYIQGGATLVWLAAWWLWTADSPAKHSGISKGERDYIESNLSDSQSESPPIPWQSFFTSLPFWSILVANFANNWGFHLLMTELPQYLSEVFNEDVQTNALISTLPYVIMWVFSFVVALLADFMIRQNVKTVYVRKFFNTTAHLGCALCLLVIAVFATTENKNETLTKVMFCVGVGLMGALYSGFFCNPQEIGPHFAGTILGITNGFGNLPGFVAPLIAGYIVNDDPSDVNKWRIVWIIAVVIMSSSSIFFFIFSSGTAQPWNDESEATPQSSKVGTIVYQVFLVGIVVAIFFSTTEF